MLTLHLCIGRWIQKNCGNAKRSAASFGPKEYVMFLGFNWGQNSQPVSDIDIQPEVSFRISSHFESLKWSHPEAVDVHRTANFKGVINLSQQINRMGTSTKQCPCITPQAILWHIGKGRLLTAGDKFVMQHFPVHKLKFNCLTQKDPKQK